jgi:hypothetical protein
MRDDDLEEKYLDPDQNPMIRTGQDEATMTPNPKAAGPDPFLDPEQNPFLPKGEGGGQARTTGIDVQAEINRLYPEADLVDLEDGRRLERMADRRTWQLDGKPLKDLDAAALADLDKGLKTT